MKAMLLVYVLLISCNSARVKKDTKLNISINIGQSYTIDLSKKIYTVFFLSRSPLHVKFNLTGDEAEKIKDMYFSLKLYDIGNVELKDTCLNNPKIYTYVNVKSNSIDQQIKIDESCRGFKDNYGAYRVNKFIQLVQEIIKSKEEIKDAPSSDVEYM
ncbi:MAG: hypothetical protein Q8941_06845 [Bacteroidota bacterium]|nr:hypothetical protein [Bacteroidota bacterium]